MSAAANSQPVGAAGTPRLPMELPQCNIILDLYGKFTEGSLFQQFLRRDNIPMHDPMEDIMVKFLKMILRHGNESGFIIRANPHEGDGGGGMRVDVSFSICYSDGNGQWDEGLMLKAEGPPIPSGWHSFKLGAVQNVGATHVYDGSPELELNPPREHRPEPEPDTSSAAQPETAKIDMKRKRRQNTRPVAGPSSKRPRAIRQRAPTLEPSPLRDVSFASPDLNEENFGIDPSKLIKSEPEETWSGSHADTMDLGEALDMMLDEEDPPRYLASPGH
ncbi:hypothetical protein F4778DRAFT_780397 [Xylariomycetidae sp. FL2044]|nr:hypothetical protein F4778DRAFT_780397 [Xylariomycetidae sp. FL2044]